MVKTKISVVRTLNLPRDFQLYRGRTAVAKTSATSGFAVMNRAHPGFRLGVRCVAHTMRAFVQYVLLRFRVWKAREEKLSRDASLARLSLFFAPVLLPRLGDLLALVRLLRWLFHLVWGWLRGFFYRRPFRSREAVLFERASSVVSTLGALPCPPRCRCSKCALVARNKAVRREWERAIVREAEASGKRPFEF